MNELSSLGLILLLALLAGHLVKFLHIPEVSGYLLAGVALGPSALGWISHENLNTLSIFSEVTLGLILFSVGAVFEFSRLRNVGRQLFFLTLTESSLAATLVIIGVLLQGASWQVALLLGAISMETAVASTLMVMRESNASGPLTDTLLGVIATNNVLCLVIFSLFATVVELSGALRMNSAILQSLYRSIFPLLWQLGGSVALGYLVGILLASWASKVVEHGEVLILLVGCVLLTVGAAVVLDLSPLLSSLAVGATMVNLSARSRTLFAALSHTDPPLYAIFFVIAGADLYISLLSSIGVLGAIYIGCRAVGKFVGASIGSRVMGFGGRIPGLLGFAMLTQAGLAIGLTLSIQRRFPEFSPVISAVVLSSIIVFEMIGPIATRFAIVRSGESSETEPELPPGVSPQDIPAGDL
ncbi:MAG: cation:proton antiporter [Acidobacteria bacterium]|nr:cation:proton antiporter [Acidobacteriota bacterium]